MTAWRAIAALRAAVLASVATKTPVRGDPYSVVDFGTLPEVFLKGDTSLRSQFTEIGFPPWMAELFTWLMEWLPDSQLATIGSDFFGAVPLSVGTQDDAEYGIIPVWVNLYHSLPMLIAWLEDDIAVRLREPVTGVAYKRARVYKQADEGARTLRQTDWRDDTPLLFYTLDKFLNPTGATPEDRTTTVPTRTQMRTEVGRAAAAIYTILGGGKYALRSTGS